MTWSGPYVRVHCDAKDCDRTVLVIAVPSGEDSQADETQINNEMAVRHSDWSTYGASHWCPQHRRKEDE